MTDVTDLANAGDALGKAPHKATQQPSVATRDDSQPKNDNDENAEKTSDLQAVASMCESDECDSMGQAGFEPALKGF